MLLQIFISAFSIGLLSSFHCVGMCGAFAFSLPVQEFSNAKKNVAILLYNVGRIATYSAFGLLFGLAGRQLYLGGFQQWFSIIAGVAIILIALQTLIKYPFLHFIGFNKFNFSIQKLVSKALQNKSLTGIMLLGMANGLLPCGLVYLAIAGAIGTGSVNGAGLFMLFFGLGTMPAMFALSYFGFFIKLSARNAIKKAMPWFICLMGIILLLRGMGLGIGYISPLLEKGSASIISCHK